MVDKKIQIIQAAIEVFAKKGLERGKIADIALQAGIGKGTIYEYFKSKHEIFSAIENLFIKDTVAQIEKLVSSEKSPTEKIEEIINYSVNMHEIMGDAILIISEMWAQHSRGKWHGRENSIFAEMYNSYHETVKGILAEGIETGEFRKMNKDGIAALLLAFIDGIIWQNFIFKEDEDFDKRKNEAIKSFMNGIKK